MKRILLAVTALALAGSAVVTLKALRYRKDAQLWHSRWSALHGDPGGLSRYRADNDRLRRAGRVDHRVVFLGASITESLELARLFPNEPLVNRGAGGQLIWQQWLRLEPDALSLEPAAVVLKVCAINWLPGALSEEETRRYYTLMADAIRARGAKVIHATAVPVTPSYDNGDGDGHLTERLGRFNAWVREEATRHHEPLLDYAHELSNSAGNLRENLSDDGLHPNAAGREVMAALIRRVVVDGFVHAAPAP